MAKRSASEFRLSGAFRAVFVFRVRVDGVNMVMAVVVVMIVVMAVPVVIRMIAGIIICVVMVMMVVVIMLHLKAAHAGAECVTERAIGDV